MSSIQSYIQRPKKFYAKSGTRKIVPTSKSTKLALPEKPENSEE